MSEKCLETLKILLCIVAADQYAIHIDSYSICKSLVSCSIISWKYPGTNLIPNGNNICNSTPWWVLSVNLFWLSGANLIWLYISQINLCETASTSQVPHLFLRKWNGLVMSLHLGINSYWVIPADPDSVLFPSWMDRLLHWNHLGSIGIEVSWLPHSFPNSFIVGII